MLNMKPSQEYLDEIKRKLSRMNTGAGLPENPGEINKEKRDSESIDFFDVLGSSAIKWMRDNKKDQK